VNFNGFKDVGEKSLDVEEQVRDLMMLLFVW